MAQWQWHWCLYHVSWSVSPGPAVTNIWHEHRHPQYVANITRLLQIQSSFANIKNHELVFILFVIRNCFSDYPRGKSMLCGQGNTKSLCISVRDQCRYWEYPPSLNIRDTCELVLGLWLRVTLCYTIDCRDIVCAECLHQSQMCRQPDNKPPPLVLQMMRGCRCWAGGTPSPASAWRATWTRESSPPGELQTRTSSMQTSGV